MVAVLPSALKTAWLFLSQAVCCRSTGSHGHEASTCVLVYPHFTLSPCWPLRVSLGRWAFLAWLDFYYWNVFPFDFDPSNTYCIGLSFQILLSWARKGVEQTRTSCRGQEPRSRKKSQLQLFFIYCVDPDKMWLCGHPMRCCPDYSWSTKTTEERDFSPERMRVELFSQHRYRAELLQASWPSLLRAHPLLYFQVWVLTRWPALQYTTTRSAILESPKQGHHWLASQSECPSWAAVLCLKFLCCVSTFPEPILCFLCNLSVCSAHRHLLVATPGSSLLLCFCSSLSALWQGVLILDFES